MTSNQLVLDVCLFQNIHIPQQGAVVYGDQRAVSINRCYFQNIVTDRGGSCIDLNSSSLIIESSCFLQCKSANNGDDSFSNIAKLIGQLLKLSMISSHLCADSVDSGDSSFYGECDELNMSDTNASSNYSPSGASSMRTIATNSQKLFFSKRNIDINSAKYTTFEVRSDIDISYSSFLNTTSNLYVFVSPSVMLSWCVFRNQCKAFNYYTSSIKFALNCYSDQDRSELSSTTSLFGIPFVNMDIKNCKKKIEKHRNVCSSSKGNSLINKSLLFCLCSFSDETSSI